LLDSLLQETEFPWEEVEIPGDVKGGRRRMV